MNRKEFIKKSCGLGAASAAAMAIAKSAGAQTEGKKEAEKSDPAQKFREDWIRSFFKNLDSQFDEKTRIRLMESCGRDCARRGSVKMAESCKGDVDKLVNTLAGHIGKENAKREGNVVRLTYNECYCPLVAKGPPRLTDTYCNCSRGWALEMFETVTGKPVKVECVASIKRGDPKCEFEVKIS